MNKPIRKSKKLRLSFPYDWSNSNIRDDALILNVLDRGIFEDICRICAHYGMDRVKVLAATLKGPAADLSLPRMLTNIEKGFSRAKARIST